MPRERRGGFDTWIGYENNNAQFDCHVHGHRRTRDEIEEVERYRLPSFETDDLTNLAIEHLETLAAEGEPFFVVLSVQPPHDPYTAPAEWMRRHRPADVVLPRNVPPVPRIEEQARARSPAPVPSSRTSTTTWAACGRPCTGWASPTTPPWSTSPTTATSTAPMATSANARRTRAA